MRAICLLVIVLMGINAGFSQEISKLALAQKHIEANTEKWGLDANDVKSLQVSSEATSEKGITYLYLNQAVENIPIQNAMIVMVMDKQGKVQSDAHTLVSDIRKKINTTTPKINPENAIVTAASHLGVQLKSAPEKSARANGAVQYFELPEMVKSSIPAQLKYILVNDKLVLVWNLNLDMKSSADYWDLNVDATTGNFISKYNYTTYCSHNHDAFANHSRCEIKTFRKLNENRVSMTEAIASGSAAATYNVFALPAESPNHGGRKIVTDDQYPAASPFGWHDTNGAAGAEFTTTRGNNVFAYQDKDDNDEPDGVATSGGTGLVFDFPIDMSKDPRESSDASVTNLFYMVNMMHDVTHQLGFTEEFGNFQQTNYGGKGDGGDYVLAQAFDGIDLHEAGQTNPPKVNNANFSTPSDGFNGRMQMFFWTNEGGSVSIDAPEQIKGFISEYGTGQFGRPIPANDETPITAKVALARDNSANPTAGCGTIANGSEVAGKIAMMDRGLCEFSKKVLNAQQSGAVAAIICNIVGVNGGNGEEILGMAGGANGGSVSIPSIFLKKSDCDKIRVIIDNGGEVTMTFQERERQGAEYLDGSLDNGIIAHEFGHGISIRLTGGRLNSSCLNNDEQMGEGWSDFFSLIMTHESGDKPEDVRGIGTFATAQQVTGGGIRRYPYSVDLAVNPQTFDDIKGTTAPHPLGEVWAGVLWDMYWAFIDLYGFDPDWKNTSSGNYKAAYLVMEGMKMQACNPGFIQGRDAILKADEMHNNGAHKCLIWEVFARRGLGFYANGGVTSDRNDGTEDFEPLPTCIEKLKITKTATASINAGDEVTVTLKAINHIPSRQSNVIITDELPAGMTYVNGSSNIAPVVSGNLLTFEVGDMDYERELVITYKTKSSINNKSVRLVLENFDGSFEWDIEKEEGSEDWLPTSDLFRSPETSFNIINVAAESDASLRSVPYQITGNNPAMRFWHRYNTQNGIDGGFVEVSVNNGAYTPIKKEQFIRNGYNGPLSYSTLAIPALDAFSGNSGGNWSATSNAGPWIDSYIDMSPYKGQTVTFRFRFGSDATTVAAGDLKGWYVDDFELLDIYKYSAEACIAADNGQGEKACTLPVETLVNSEVISSNEDVVEDFFEAIIEPNPANDYLSVHVKAPVRSQAMIEILNSGGTSVYNTKVQLTESFYSTFIDTSVFPAGMYFVRIKDGNKTTVKKLILQ